MNAEVNAMTKEEAKAMTLAGVDTRIKTILQGVFADIRTEADQGYFEISRTGPTAVYSSVASYLRALGYEVTEFPIPMGLGRSGLNLLISWEK